jgi:hypothetical protein
MRLKNAPAAVVMAACLVLNLSDRVVAANPSWWIVLATTSEVSDPQQMDADVRRIGAAATPCRIDWFNDFSGKFQGFAQGYMVFVIGPFKSKAATAKQAASAHPCFKGLYVKRATYLGE